MSKITKRSCLDLIKDKELPYTIQRVGQMDRLVANKQELVGILESIPIFSWKRLYDFLLILSGGATS